ncbi:MAG: cytochrome c biogenesis protein CcdA [Candidatus Krumholzibacteria bacterium]|jgi:thiol:disulfide interchange protein DsbD|nr:cytochrome c biogenesis protein CcdA [Candidatus Krumholzibacteria bacterium]MDP6669288.1 cytochrome c biogenesis protein CcdA [Candidatus Krumholzibacteria bacterium]MDP6796689.1 cytochrome c biogenesis protein CcdA [Candidatus Krumholzibacteria bacterium]MDP7020746.1 cytochrome c biogenesis protein CcdA [Candidatus Krumholzibacteria bacterium]
MRTFHFTLAFLGCLILSAAALPSEDPFAVPEIELRLEALASPLVAGETVEFALVYTVPEHTHLTDAFLGIEFKSDPPLKFSQASWPKAILEKGSEIYRGEFRVRTQATLPEEATEFSLLAEAEYQICQEGAVEMCFPPALAKATYSASLEVAGTSFENLGEPASISKESKGLAGRLEAALEKGSWLAFLLVFLGGVLTSFTPCVYPMIPITISFIGGSAKGNPLKGFVLSLWFVLGIAIMYSSLGLLAAATGGAFGQATQTPLFAGIVAAIIGTMGLSMAGLFDIQLPSSMTSRVGGARTGFLGPILMGMAMGLIAAPCVGPVLIVLLTWVATSGSLFLGFWLLFTFAIGLGLLFIALGTFSGLLTALPGAGGWMDTVKHFFALLLFALALSFLKPWLPATLLWAVFGASLVFSFSYWGVWKKGSGLKLWLSRLAWIAGILLILLSALQAVAPERFPALALPGTGAVSHEEPEWIWNEKEAFALARSEGKPLMMDFWAEWCAACNELDHKSYSREEILLLAEDFVPLKMDMTRKSPENEAILKQYGVRGMPTVIFFSPEGEEIERFFGFLNAKDLAVTMQRVLNTKEQ